MWGNKKPEDTNPSPSPARETTPLSGAHDLRPLGAAPAAPPRAADRLQISKSGNVVGDLVAARIVIEDGAYFKGSIDIQKPEEKARRVESAGEGLRITPVAAASKDKVQ